MAEKRRTSRSKQAEPGPKAPGRRPSSRSTARTKQEPTKEAAPERTRGARTERGERPRPRRTATTTARPGRGARSERAEVRLDTLRIKLVRSPIGAMQRHKDTVRTLGLRRLNQVVERPDSPQLRGMIFAVKHLVQVVE